MFSWLAFAWVLLVLATGCNSSPSDPAADDTTGQGGEPRGAVAINEIAATVPSVADWVELLNRSGRAVDLSGHFLTDALDRLDHYFALPAGTVLAPGERMVVWAGEGAEPGLHVPFSLGRGDGVWLVSPDGLPVDGLPYLAPQGGPTLARLPDGEGLFHAAQPTQGEANRGLPAGSESETGESSAR